MINTDENALICDLAETYQIYNYKQLPLTTVAVFAYGLRSDSRIQMKLNNWNVDIKTQLMANIFDVVNTLLWTKTKDAEKGINRPKSIFDVFSGNEQVKTSDKVVFNSGKEFEDKRNQLLKGGK